MCVCYRCVCYRCVCVLVLGCVCVCVRRVCKESAQRVRKIEEPLRTRKPKTVNVERGFRLRLLQPWRLLFLILFLKMFIFLIVLFSCLKLSDCAIWLNRFSFYCSQCHWAAENSSAVVSHAKKKKTNKNKEKFETVRVSLLVCVLRFCVPPPWRQGGWWSLTLPSSSPFVLVSVPSSRPLSVERDVGKVEECVVTDLPFTSLFSSSKIRGSRTADAFQLGVIVHHPLQ